MISDDPEADADALDDDQVLGAYLGIDARDAEAGMPYTAAIPDWPPHQGEAVLGVDGEIADWFKSRHANWRAEIRLVLRAWVAAHADT
jgi:hypothetical protein